MPFPSICLRLAVPLIAAAVSGCSVLPQSGPNMTSVEEVAADRDIVFTTLAADTVNAYRRTPEIDRPLENNIPIGQMRLRLGPGDVLRIQMFETGTTGSLFGGPEGAGLLNRVVIDDRGTINLPYAGSLKGAGLTPAELQAAITERLSRIAVEPAAYVEVLEDYSNSVMIAGAVPQPGRLSLRTGVASALDAINAAGGIEGASWHHDLVLRRDDIVRRYTVSQLLNGGDFALEPGDRLQVAFEPKRFIALGALTTSGAFEFPTPRPSLLDALATARGLSDRQANRQGVYLFRPQDRPEERHQLFLLDMSEPDSILVADAFAVKPGDAIYVSNAILTDVNKVLDPILRSIAIFNFSTTVGE